MRRVRMVLTHSSSLNEFGQSVWLDFVSRELLRTGALTKLIADDGLRGVTSNPSISEKAIGYSDDDDALIVGLMRMTEPTTAVAISQRNIYRRRPRRRSRGAWVAIE